MKMDKKIYITFGLILANGLFVYSDYFLLKKVNWWSPFIIPLSFIIGYYLTQKGEK